MRVYILGIDGYLGWRLQKHLRNLGHLVEGCDNYFRRSVANSLVPLERDQPIERINVTRTDALAQQLRNFRPDVVVHFAEIASAPYSMENAATCINTQRNNVLGSLSVLQAMRIVCPEAHLIKLGSMGEYIPSSWYHMSKVLDSHNCIYASELWGLRVTDVMQGPVYGVGGRFDYDDVWGTVLNRWVAMGLTNHDLLVYGDGQQVRGFLPIEDSMQCFEIQIQDPPESGEYRVVNQYAEKYTLNELAEVIAGICGVGVKHIENPRKEKRAYSGPSDTSNRWLRDRGYEPTEDIQTALQRLVEHVKPHRARIDPDGFTPKVRW